MRYLEKAHEKLDGLKNLFPAERFIFVNRQIRWLDKKKRQQTNPLTRQKKIDGVTKTKYTLKKKDGKKKRNKQISDDKNNIAHVLSGKNKNLPKINLVCNRSSRIR